MGRRARIVGTLLLATSAPSFAACGVDGLAFREDTRIEIVSPGDRDEVTLPTTIRWTAHDVDGTFAVLVDRPPQPPGETVAWFARDDADCEQLPDCPGAAYLAERGVFTTAERELTLEGLPDRTGDGRRRDRHEVTVILLDDAGRRVGESAWSVELQVERGD